MKNVGIFFWHPLPLPSIQILNKFCGKFSATVFVLFWSGFLSRVQVEPRKNPQGMPHLAVEDAVYDIGPKLKGSLISTLAFDGDDVLKKQDFENSRIIFELSFCLKSLFFF